jgi:hypothetical protein
MLEELNDGLKQELNDGVGMVCLEKVEGKVFELWRVCNSRDACTMAWWFSKIGIASKYGKLIRRGKKFNCWQKEAKLVDVVPETGGQYNRLG